jgi:hypothetical protein
MRFKPSPALVIASAALLVALGETSWATVSQLVPRNSVGTAQLRTGALTSAKIRNGGGAPRDLALGAREFLGPEGRQAPPGRWAPRARRKRHEPLGRRERERQHRPQQADRPFHLVVVC